MSNPYYTHSGYPATGVPGASASARAEFDLIETAFAKLPTISGNASKAVIINAGATGLGVTTGTLALAGNFATVGAFAITLTASAATTLTLPTSGTLLTTDGSAAALTNFPTLNQNTTGSSASCSGNAATATKLATARAINGTNFDGSAAITVTADAGTLTGTTLAATVLTSSLTAVGTITTGVWNGTAVTVQYGGTGIATTTPYSVICAGTTATGAFQSLGALGAATTVLTSNGPSALPSFQALTAKRVKVGTFTYDVSTASGTVAITGVGFTPRLLFFSGGVPAVTGYASWGGMDDGTTATCTTMRDASGNFQHLTKTNRSIFLQGTDGTSAEANISAFGADGYTLNWTKTGSPTGTATIGYTAFE